ncbi:MAG: hypothetical protein RE471_09810 [Ferroplasma sp.]|uniref:hypothetical protein n=1 Tax=Ferroplasma sp. TaxID=2591003 RepID=UPI0028166A80|nr:hypothetical protein [Ferroplasma sp.]WMT51259.1 MAG: hypothetical protein RE471_09810 [Ferroplasma sp.]
MKSVPNNPLDHIMQRYAGQAVTPESILLDYPNFSDVFEVEDRLKEWVRRNKDDCQVLHANPYMVKVFVTPHDINVYNQNMHRKHQEARRGIDEFYLSCFFNSFKA